MRILKTLFDLPSSGARPVPDASPNRKARLRRLARDREICRDELMTFATESMLVCFGRPEHLRSCSR